MKTYSKETLINSLPHIYGADFTSGFGKNTQNTTSIPAFFAYVRRKIHLRIRRQAINQCFPKILAFALSVCVMFVMTTPAAFAESGAKTVSKASNVSSIAKSISDLAQKKSGAGSKYVEGEAIVLIKSTSASSKKPSLKSGENDSSIPTDILPKGASVEEKVHFDAIPEDEITQDESEQSTKVKPLKSGSKTYIDYALMRKDVDVCKIKSSVMTTKELVAALRANAEVLFAGPNYKTKINSNDKYFGEQWSINNTGQNQDSGASSTPDINLDSVPASVNGAGKVIAVVDTGFDFEHEDLAGKEWDNNMTARLAGSHGYDFANYDTDPQDDNGHGSHVSGIIAANTDNSKGIAGITPGVKIMPLKVFDSWGDGDLYSIIEAYDYIYRAQELGVKVSAVNNSWGTFGEEETGDLIKAVIDRIGEKGAVSVCAAGNEAYEMSDEDPYDFEIPAQIKSPYIISVAAATESGELANFSNYGKDAVDLAAPGTSILSTVSYNNYSPYLIDAAGGSADDASFYYKNYNDPSPDITGIKTENFVAGETTTDGSTVAAVTGGFGSSSTNTHAVKWTITDADPGDIYNIYIPYTPKATSANPIMMSADAKVLLDVDGGDYELFMESYLAISDVKLKTDESLPYDFYLTDAYDASRSNYWFDISAMLRSEVKDTSKHALVFTYISDVGGTQEILLDNIGISEPNPVESYPKYGFYSGTSMAAPMVTAAAAIVSQAHSGYSAKQLAAAVRSMADPSDKLNDKVISGGMLDLSKYSEDNPYLEKAAISGSNVIIKGASLSPGGTLSAKISGAASGTSLAPSSWTKDSITVSAKNLKNRNVVFEVTRSDGRKTTLKSYVVEGKSKFTAVKNADEILSSTAFTTDGKSLFMAEDGYIAKLEKDGWEEGEFINPEKMFPAANSTQLSTGYVVFESEPVYLNGLFYAVVVLGAGATSEYALASYNPKNSKWTRVADRPGAETKAPYDAIFSNITGSTLAAYNGKLYLLGGFNGKTNAAARNVRIFSPSKKKWSKGKLMPQARFSAITRQVGGKLYMVLGGDGTLTKTKTPDILIYDGKTWTAKPGISKPLTNDAFILPAKKGDPDAVEYLDYWTDDIIYVKELPVFRAAVGIVGSGLMFAGLGAEGLGDTYTYAISSSKYTASKYQLSQENLTYGNSGVAVGAKFYATVKSDSEPDESYDEEYEEFGEGGGGSDAALYSISVKSGLLKVSGKAKNGKLSGYGSYLPGQNVTLKATPKKNYYFKYMTVGGAKKTAKSFTIKSIAKNTTVNAVFAKYATKVKLNKTSATLKAGKTLKLKAKVTKSAKGVKGVTWKSSNKKYATVSRTGKVTAKRAGKGKTVYIYATAKDGSKRYARAEIRIA